MIALTLEVWEALVLVNDQVNQWVKGISDREHWGTADRWDLPEDGAGDCEDFQLLKRKMLVTLGLPHRAMRMTVVVDEDGEGHAVLMARTDRGDLILDNKRDDVLPWKRTGYHYVKREGQDSATWTALKAPVTAVAAADE